MHPPITTSRLLGCLLAWRSRPPDRGASPAVQGPLLGKWIGQDGHDLVGGNPGPSKNDFQDIHLAVRGIPPGRSVVEVIVRGHGGGEWGSNNKDANGVVLVRKGNATRRRPLHRALPARDRPGVRGPPQV